MVLDEAQPVPRSYERSELNLSHIRAIQGWAGNRDRVGGDFWVKVQMGAASGQVGRSSCDRFRSTTPAESTCSKRPSDSNTGRTPSTTVEFHDQRLSRRPLFLDRIG